MAQIRGGGGGVNLPSAAQWKMILDADFTGLATDATALTPGDTISCGGRTFTISNAAGDSALTSDIVNGDGLRIRGDGTSDFMRLIFPTMSTLLPDRQWMTPIVVSVEVRMATWSSGAGEVDLRRRRVDTGTVKEGHRARVLRNVSPARLDRGAQTLTAVPAIDDTVTVIGITPADLHTRLTLWACGESTLAYVDDFASTPGIGPVATAGLDDLEGGGETGVGDLIRPDVNSTGLYTPLSQEQFRFVVTPAAASSAQLVLYLRSARAWAWY